MEKGRLIKIGRTYVKSAIGFFWRDGYKMYVAGSREDKNDYIRRGYGEGEFHGMAELESAFRNSSAMRFVSWCGQGSIVRQGARQVTFTYDTHKVSLRIK